MQRKLSERQLVQRKRVGQLAEEYRKIMSRYETKKGLREVIEAFLELYEIVRGAASAGGNKAAT